MKSSHYNDNVFINCPFDSTYKPLFDAMVFAVHDCGFIARCALEEGDASEVRIDKIYSIIADSCYGIHDISRIELDDDLKVEDLIFSDYIFVLGEWLVANSSRLSKSRSKR